MATQRDRLQPQYGAPDVVVRAPGGRTASLKDAAGPIFVVAFVAPPEGDCCAIAPRVRKLADELWLDGVNVAQITQPTADCPLAPAATADCPAPGRNLRRFLDADRVAWSAFGRPANGTLYLIDRRGDIETVGAIDNPDWLLYRAHELGRELEREWWDWWREGSD